MDVLDSRDLIGELGTDAASDEAGHESERPEESGDFS
jgi:hypothetical protein